MEMQAVFVVIIAASGWALAYHQFRKASFLRKFAKEALEDADRHQRKVSTSLDKLEASEKSLHKMADDAAEKLILVAGKLGEADLECEKQRKLAQDRQEMLEGVIQEKQIVWRMYRDSTRQAGVAQNWLMREYSATLQALNDYREQAGEREVQAPKELRDLLGEFAVRAKAVPNEAPALGERAEKTATKPTA